MNRAASILFSLLAGFTSLMAQDNISFSNIIEINPGDTRETIIAKAAHVVPNPRQAAALENEFIGFIHFGPNTFSGREWGSGMEDPTLFNPSDVDADQWVKVMKEAGMKMIILTVKHHDGYVLWQSRYTDHGIMQSPYLNGQGDVLRDLAEACKKYDMKLGIYLSPADLYQIESPDGLYGNESKKSLRTIPRQVEGRPFANPTQFTFEVDDYNEYFMNQLFEVLTEYGPVHEVWFDGANPKEKGGQTYDYDAWLEVVHTLAPEAVVFGAGDVRWCGNEAGYTRETEWNVVPFNHDPSRYTGFEYAQKEDIGSIDMLEKHPYLKYVYPETDTSIRDGWFYRDDVRQDVRSADDVYDIYERAVGGNSTLLLNVPPNKEGKFSPRDVEALLEVGKRIAETYSHNLLENAHAPAELLDNDRNTSVPVENEVVITLPQAATFNRIVLQEDVTHWGERIARHAVDAMINGEWEEIASGTNVGYKRILRFPDVTTNALRVRVEESRLTPHLSAVAAHYYQVKAPQLDITRDAEGNVAIFPRKSEFRWKNSLNDAIKNLSQGSEIRYTVDGSEPDSLSTKYDEPFKMPGRGVVKARSFLAGTQSAVTSREFGADKSMWRAMGNNESAHKAIDNNNTTYWTDNSETAILTIDFGQPETFSHLSITPQRENTTEGMIAKGKIETSADGNSWSEAGIFEFGNLINDPTQRYYYFETPVTARYLRIVPLEIAGKSKIAAISEVDIY